MLKTNGPWPNGRQPRTAPKKVLRGLLCSVLRRLVAAPLRLRARPVASLSELGVEESRRTLKLEGDRARINAGNNL